MKKILFCLGVLLQSVCCFAGHIAGGEVYYKYVRPGANNTSIYQISLRLFRECDAGGANVADMPTEVVMAIYTNTASSTQFGPQQTIPRTSFQTLLLGTPNPCISNPSRVCYQVGTFTFTQQLPNTAAGYIVMFQTCCRTNLIDNIQLQNFINPDGQSTNGEGATYTGQIPGSNTLTPGSVNSSPVFSLKDTTLVCQNTLFRLDFSAADPDLTDSLSYSFCAAYDRGRTTAAADFNYSPPPYNAVTYTPGFSGTAPLGPAVSINPVTGIISGIAPAVGRYVVTVCITEWRAGKAISQHRKDFTLRVDDCTLTGAALKPQYITCDGYTLSFENQSTSSSINSYLWDFGEKVPATSTAPTPTHTYSDTGVYVLKLKVTSTTGCQDSTTAPVKIYPGFTSDFTIQGSCYLNAYKFFDATVSKYGVVDSWKWQFGDASTLADTARSKDSSWKYSALQTAQVTLITTNSKGCIDTITKPLVVSDKPTLNLPFRDTLICSNDTLMLKVISPGGTVLWTPENGPNKTRIINANTTTPLVFPRDTTRYYVSINDNGCANSDSVRVNVLPFITVDAGRDTGICRADSLRLRPESAALSYQWTASTGERIEAIKYPQAKPLVDTRYFVLANLGKCQARDSVLVRVAAYPNASAGSDVTICFGTRVQLHGNATGTVFSWSPANSLINENTLTPTAGPVRTTAYILSATDTVGCPKPKTDTIVVTVIPPITAYAGNDTTVLPDQPVPLLATGGSTYSWSPPTGLSDPNIANPVAMLNSAYDSVTYTVRVTDKNGCYSEDQVTVRIFNTVADILVPSGFTPNGDGKNDVARPITIGITKLQYFSIYNRWGQLLFTTNETGKGWNGVFNGVAQPAGAYVYQARGFDFLGSAVYRKGTIVLIR
ncbi:MAG: type sorting protein [Sediminibacterium sp.]|nr:type sorting protein [Sediminibacterium sp.]